MDPLHAPRQPWRLDERGRRWFDRTLVAVLLLPVPLMALSGLSARSVTFTVLELVPLLWRRSRPVAVFAAVAGVSALQAVVLHEPTWGQVAFPVATYAVARYADALASWVALGVGLCAAWAATYSWFAPYSDNDRTGAVSYIITMSVIVIAAWALGTLGRTRQAYVAALVERGERIELEAAQRVELAATEERTRIAREMHDVVAHGLSVIVVQADGARYAAEHDPAVATRTLETVAATGREALTEMRRLLGLLRTGGETGTRPQPRLDDIAVLVAEAQEVAARTGGGGRVEARLPEPGVPVPPGIALTAYRVVQEALTNIRKHAGPGAAVRVEVCVGTDVEVVVEDDGRGAATPDDGRGLGLVGMRERVLVHDGELVAGPRPGGGFRVSARLPL
ncbi:histidine kinase [Nocardioides sp. zg-DK7169]|uniref:sensor histidine kinase n=1 Tax=Nocardioides sp. zg-DK7169 TaxID=2736600 RepID=UPI00155740A6|nr:sensor histidine kinase [Nocardioides sp. zg-DK7169]